MTGKWNKINEHKRVLSFLMTILLLLSLVGCGKLPKINSASSGADVAESAEDIASDVNSDKDLDSATEEEASDEVIKPSEEELPSEEEIVSDDSKADIAQIKYEGTYWVGVIEENYGYLGDSESGYMELPTDYFSCDVFFYDDGKAFLRVVMGDEYDQISRMGDWVSDGNGGVRIMNAVQPNGEDLGYYASMLIPHFLPAGDDAPDYEKQLISLDYMGGTIYFEQKDMPTSEEDPFRGVDLYNAQKVRDCIAADGLEGEWVLHSGEYDGEKWYALESGVVSTIYIYDHYMSFSHTAEGEEERYDYMTLVYDDIALYEGHPCSYSLTAIPDTEEYASYYRYQEFSIAPDGDYLTLIRYIESKEGNSIVLKWNYQRGWG